MSILTKGAVAALFMGVLMGATLKPGHAVATHAQAAPHLVMDPDNNGLLASVNAAERRQS